MAPTVMVARVALASNRSDNEPNTAHISDLEFQREASGVVTSWTVPGSAEDRAAETDFDRSSAEQDEKRT